jgi:hypothetical protein
MHRGSSIEGFTVENITPQGEEHPRHWSTGDTVKVRSETADNWRDAHALIQWGQKLLLVVPKGIIHPDGTRQTRSSLKANAEPGADHRSLDGPDYEVREHHRG